MIQQVSQSGFTLIELVAVILIIGILTAVAIGKLNSVVEKARFEETRDEMDRLVRAIVGDPGLHNHGIRSDFGYVGDVGAPPPNLDALVSNPGGYATWRGPYIDKRTPGSGDDYKRDAWQDEYIYGGTTITSIGSGNDITMRFAASIDDLLYNTVSGVVLDRSGVPPGYNFMDSLRVRLVRPDGGGSMVTADISPDPDGFFTFDSVPVGNHSLEIVYIPENDTSRFVASVNPGSGIYREYYLTVGLTSDDTGGLVKAAQSDSLTADCHGFSFWVRNGSGISITIESLRLTWSTPTAYYRYVRWNEAIVFDRSNPRAAPGEWVLFSSPQTIVAGQSLKIEVDFFKSTPVGGNNVDVDNTGFDVDLSDGSSFHITTGDCP
jgi:prepilin-type N-terminal cleavage/methylation domain-containing protein